MATLSESLYEDEQEDAEFARDNAEAPHGYLVMKDGKQMNAPVGSRAAAESIKAEVGGEIVPLVKPF